MNKRFIKVFRRKFSFLAIRLFTVCHGVLPLWWCYCWGGLLGRACYYVLPRHSKIALDSLSVAFPKKSLKEKKKNIKKFFSFMAQGALELVHMVKNPKSIERNVSIKGEGNLKAALGKGKGVILVTAHIGNFPVLGLKLASSGYKVSFVARPMRDPKIGDYLHSLRENAGIKTIYSHPRKDCITGIINTLRNNEIIIILMDQNYDAGGVWVKFFGKLAATPVGAIVLGIRTGAAMVPAYIHCDEKHKHYLSILPQEDFLYKEDKDEMILVNAIKFTRIIEGWIREYTHQWGWIHRRWKYQPSERERSQKFKIEE